MWLHKHQGKKAFKWNDLLNTEQITSISLKTILWQKKIRWTKFDFLWRILPTCFFFNIQVTSFRIWGFFWRIFDTYRCLKLYGYKNVNIIELESCERRFHGGQSLPEGLLLQTQCTAWPQRLCSNRAIHFTETYPSIPHLKSTLDNVAVISLLEISWKKTPSETSKEFSRPKTVNSGRSKI